MQNEMQNVLSALAKFASFNQKANDLVICAKYEVSESSQNSKTFRFFILTHLTAKADSFSRDLPLIHIISLFSNNI